MKIVIYLLYIWREHEQINYAKGFFSGQERGGGEGRGKVPPSSASEYGNLKCKERLYRRNTGVY